MVCIYLTCSLFSCLHMKIRAQERNLVEFLMLWMVKIRAQLGECFKEHRGTKYSQNIYHLSHASRHKQPAVHFSTTYHYPKGPKNNEIHPIWHASIFSKGNEANTKPEINSSIRTTFIFIPVSIMEISDWRATFICSIELDEMGNQFSMYVLSI